MLVPVIRTIETRLVPYSSRNIDLPVPDFGFAKKEAEPAAASPSGDGESADSTSQQEDSADTADDKQQSAERVTGKKRKLNGKSVGAHVVAKKDDEIRGHTAYLTFATKFFA